MIETGSRVSIEYKLKLDDGSTVDGTEGQEPLVYRHGEGLILPALEEAMAELTVGDERKISLTPEEGYGLIDPAAFQSIEPEAVPENARAAGEVLVAEDEEGNTRIVRVHEVADDHIVLDWNHPLAGQNLHFEIRIVGIDVPEAETDN